MIALVEMKQDISDIMEEINWVGEHGFPKMIYERVDEASGNLGEIQQLVFNIDMNTTE